MKKSIFTFVFVAILLSVTGANAQMVETVRQIDAHRGYFIRDGVVHNVYISKDNSRIGYAEHFSIPEQPNYAAAKFSPDQVLEYGLENGRRFFSVKIDTESGQQSFFLEKLRETTLGAYILYLPGWMASPGSRSLYFLRDKNGVVTPLGKGNEPEGIWDYFLSLNDCPKLNEVKFRRRFRSGMVNRFYNAFANCNEKAFPVARFGVTASLSGSRPLMFDDSFTPHYNPQEVLEEGTPLYANLRYDWDYSYSVGMFFRIPLDDVASFQPEILYFRSSTTDAQWGHKFRTDALRLPLMFRATNNHARGQVMPYGEIGPVFDLNFGKYSYGGSEYWTRALPRYSMGVAAGAGIECYIAPGQAISLGGRVNWVSSLERDKRYNNLSVELVLGLSLFKMVVTDR